MSADTPTADAAAAPQAHLNEAPATLLPAHLPVPTLNELDILRYLEGMSLDGHDPQLHPLSDEQAQLLEEEFNLLTLSTKDTGASDDNAPSVLGKNAAAIRIQAMARGRRTRFVLYAGNLLVVVHTIQQAWHSFAARRRSCRLAPYVL